jgi:peptide/nickel transport system permease protein
MAVEPAVAASRTGWRPLRALGRNGAATVSLAILAVVLGTALLAPIIYPGDPMSLAGKPFLWPGQDPAFPLGTDSLGRDVAAGLAWGARVTLLVGFAAMALGVFAGLIAGALAGYVGGWTDTLIVKLIEIVQTPPNFVLLVVLVAIAQPTLTTIVVAIAIVTWPTAARIVRSEFRQLRERDFVLAARSLGYGHLRIMAVEILPSALPPIIVTSSILLATAILMESALSFLGLGDPNVVTWGSMIGEGRPLLRSAWYLSAIPGIAIVITVLALNLLGDALNDALNPRRAARD